MAKFCKYCGKPIEEGKICNCPESLENAARIVNTVGATIETTKEVKDNSKRLIGLTKEYFENPTEATKKIIKEKDKSFMISCGVVFILSVILNFFTVFGRIVRDFNKFMNTSGKMFGVSFSELKEYNIIQNQQSLLLYSLIFGVIVLLILSGTLILVSKINKTSYTSKDIFLVCVINTIPFTFCLIIGGILALFVSYKILVAIQLLYFILYIIIGIISYNIIIGKFSKGKDIIIYSIITLLGIIIISGILMKLISSIIGSYEIYGETIGYYMYMIKDSIMNEIGDIDEEIFEFIYYEMF